MKYVIISDTHNRTFDDCPAIVRKQVPDADYYIHCGDICAPSSKIPGWTPVAGNMDVTGGYDYSVFRILETEHHRILVLHGHTVFSSGFPDYKALAREARRQKCDTVFFGHSHIPHISEDNGIHLFNPGSLWKNKDESAASYMIIEEDDQGTFHPRIVRYSKYD